MSENICAECNREFRRPQDLAAHQRSSGHVNTPQENETVEVESPETNETPTEEELSLTTVDEDRNYPCAICEETFATEIEFTRHVRETHKPPKREKYDETIKTILEANEGSMDREELITKCHSENPSLSAKGAQKYSLIINKLVRKGEVTIRTIVDLTEEV